MSERRLLSLGEALVDVVIRGEERREHVGGSLLNVAAGLARLGHPSSLAAWFGRDERGRAIASTLAEQGVVVEPGSDGAARTPVAYATLDDQGRATYEFDLEWRVPPLTDTGGIAHLHTGSIAATIEPGGSEVVDAVRAVRESATISYDPNVRPTLMGAPADVLTRVEELVCLADVVKASDEDVAWLYPDLPLEDALRRWAGLGPALVVCTRGPEGALAVLASDPEPHPVHQRPVDLVDTVGAGDSFMAGLLSGLLASDLLGDDSARVRLRAASLDDLMPALRRAVATSGITVARAGAYGPTLAEVLAVSAG